MKPHRMRMANNLITNYGLHKKMDILVRHHSNQIIPAQSTSKAS